MAVTYLDQEVESLVQERKPLPADWHSRIHLKSSADIKNSNWI